MVTGVVPPPPHLFERLAQLPDYTWNIDVAPVHTTFESWHVTGTYNHCPSDRSASSARTSPVIHPGASREDARITPFRPIGRTATNGVTPNTSSAETQTQSLPITARISSHAVRLEREYHLMKSIIKTASAEDKLIVRPLDLLQLPGDGSSGDYRVAIYEDPGPNYLVRALSMSSTFYQYTEVSQESVSDAQARIPLEVFLDFGIGACRVLEMLHHGHKIIHGEIRGDAFHFNRETQLVKLLNAGNGARAFEHAGGLTSDGWLTLSKEIGAKNRLQFMSPEQSGRLPIEPDTRTDIYSLGIVFWVMLVGRQAFDGGSPIEVLSNVLNKKLPSISSQRPDIPEVLSRIVQKMTQKQIMQRYQSVSGVKHDLQKVARFLGEGDSPSIGKMEIGLTDVSSFFQLPSTLFGRENHYEAIGQVIERAARKQQVFLQAQQSATLYSISSNSSISESRIETLELADATSISSSQRLSATGSSHASSVIEAAPRSPSASTRGPGSSIESPFVNGPVNGGASESLRSSVKASSDYNSFQSHQSHQSQRQSAQLNKSNVFRCELIHVIGPAGMGKSSLVNSVQPMFRKHGYFAAAKFDRSRQQPYGALISCISSFFRQIFSEKDVATSYHQGIRSLVSPIWKTLHVTLELPEGLIQYTGNDTASSAPSTHNRSLSRISRTDRDSISSMSSFQSSIPSHQSSAAEYIRGQGNNRSLRFMSLYLELLKLLARRNIAIALDDVHHADAESLELISAIMTAKVNCILILSSRNSDLPSGAELTHLTLIEIPAFSEEEVNEYVAAALRRKDVEYVIPLAATIQEKCGGNPFYINEMLMRCYAKRCIYFEWKTGQWQYSLDRVFSEFAGGPENGGRLENNVITRRLQELPPVGRSILVWASVLGTTFSITLVQRILTGEFLYSVGGESDSDETCPNIGGIMVQRTESEVLAALQHLNQLSILVPGENEDEFQFAHDRIQVAAMELKEFGRSQSKIHFIVARTMIKYGLMKSVYELAGHICNSVDILKDRVLHRLRYRDYLYKAALQASGNGARTTALRYYQDCINLLQDDPWGDKPDAYYEETLLLYTEAAELALDVQPRTANHYLEQAMEKAKTAAERAKPSILQSRLLVLDNRTKEAFEVLTTSLVDLGVPTTGMSPDESDTEYHDIKDRIKSLSREELLSKPMSKDPHILALGDVMSETLSATYWNSDPSVFIALVLRQIRVHLTHNSFPQVGIAFGRLATVAINIYHDMEWGRDLAEYSRLLLTTQSTPLTRAKGFTLYAIFLEHYFYGLQDSLMTLENALEFAYQSGDRVVTLINLGAIAQLRLSLGQDVREIERFCVDGPKEFVKWDTELNGLGTLLVAVRQVCRALQGKTLIDSPADVLADPTHDSVQFVDTVVNRGLGQHKTRPLDPYSVGKMISMYLFGFPHEALEIGRGRYQSLDGMWASRLTHMGVFYYALSMLTVLLDEPDHPEYDAYLQHAKACRSKLMTCGSISNTNYQCWTLILGAGIDELSGNRINAVAQYEDALDHAQIHNLALDEALAFELHAELLIRVGAKRTARHMLQECITSWNRISATGKAKHLATKYEFLLKTAIRTRVSDAGCQTMALQGSTLPTPSARMSQFQTRSEQTRTWLTPSETAKVAEAAPKGNDPSYIGLDVIDLSSILEFSQLMSSELQVERLLSKMVEILLESVTGQADFCAFIVEFDDDKELKIAVAGDLDHGITAYPDGLLLTDAEDMFVQQVSLNAVRFKEQLLVPQVLEDVRFLNVNDALSKRYPHGRSVVAIPIVHGDRVRGVVHLEGPPRSFTQRNLVVLNLLSNQMGISLANAMLFKRVAKVSATNASMVESQRRALAHAREAEQKAKVAEANAIKALAEAREASKAKSLFLANVSHELRTPLNGVIGMSEILKGTPLSSEQEGYTDSIKICADTLLTVINDILDYSKLESGKMGLIRVPVNLTSSITEVVRALAYTNQERGLETFKDLTLDPKLLVSADPVRLHQIFMNLLSNAYKFTPKPGKIFVRARVDQEWDKKIQITCEVQDTGIGITKAQLSRLFQPFSQADSSTMRTYGGTGLGLSICKAMIENVMHGTINLESEPNTGTKVSFTLVFDKVNPGDNGKADSADGVNRWTPSSAGGEAQSKLAVPDLSKIPRDKIRVCIAEDNPINQKIAVSFVNKLGLQCEAYGDGQQAVDALRKRSKEGSPFHLVLMDVQMPVLDGYNATKAIRKDEDPQVRDVLVIAMTASAIRGDREKCIDAGMNDYLAKPVRAQVLKAMLEGYLSQPPKEIPDLEKRAVEMADKASQDATNERERERERSLLKKSGRKGSASSLKRGLKSLSRAAGGSSASRNSSTATIVPASTSPQPPPTDGETVSHPTSSSKKLTKKLTSSLSPPPSNSAASAIPTQRPRSRSPMSPSEAMAELFAQQSIKEEETTTNEATDEAGNSRIPTPRPGGS